jgi:thermostable 8-oxoguanine DNA glycosylase
MQLPGVGPKTASWIVRNYRGSDEIAIVDIHIARACRAAGLTSARLTPSTDYFAIEDRFLQFASALGVPASYLDHLMWNVMRKIGGLLAA